MEKWIKEWIKANPKKAIAGAVGLFLLLTVAGGRNPAYNCDKARTEWQQAEEFSDRLKADPKVDVRRAFIAAQDTEKAKERAIAACKTSDK